ncbi:adenosine deaminase [Streptomyces sp. TRM49041]|uniref:adenosine deaminase family protein n=1 Tax=Streptomyces sp. TRM49041 TaxID=2603216 RepID=UPI0011ED4D87|nr:adenosine deaminase [Streptomyces sp. TRM49041]
MTCRRRRTALPRRTLLPLGLALVAALCSLTAPRPATATATATGGTLTAPLTSGSEAEAEARTAARLESIRQDPDRLREFFLRLPKGGDLHNHLGGAVPTEFLIRLAAEDGLCVDEGTLTAVRPPCGPGRRPAADARTDPAFRTALIRAWSMQDFPPGRPGHDHFFATFGRFGEVIRHHRGRQLAVVADSVARQNQFLLETMVTPVPDGARELAAETGWDPDLRRLHDKLLAGGRLDRLVDAARAEADAADAEFRAVSRCGSARPAPGCRLLVRWISHAHRNSPPELVFTQLALGMRLAERDPRFVAVNLVEPEHGDISLRDYRLHMRMVGRLRDSYPRAHVTLHAGELWPGLVKPEDLSFHIREAVDVAGAERVGHGVDLVHEDDPRRLLRTMARREVAVEVPFTSNAQILGVEGAEHPFPVYRAHGVPVVLATDDPGVSRTDISHEYRYAATAYDLGYRELKDLARASLEYAFLPGRSLWRGNPTAHGYRPVAECRGTRPGRAGPGADCRRLLAGSRKAAVQWRQEAAFAEFERRHGGG